MNRLRTLLADVCRAIDEEAFKEEQQSLTCGVPLGDGRWKARVANRLGLELTRGRPRQERDNLS